MPRFQEMREAGTKVVKYAWPIIVSGAVVLVAAQGGFVPAQFRDGALPQSPIQAIGGGQVRLELTVSSSGVVTAVETLRATPPFTDAMINAVRGWLFRSAEEETEPKPGKPADPKPQRPVESKVLVVGIFLPPTLNAPTFGEPLKDVASPSNETPFPMASVMPSYPPLARENGIVLVEVRVDPGGGVADVQVIRSAPPFDEPARDAARRWTFRPARVYGRSVAGLAYIVFAFRQPITLPYSGVQLGLASVEISSQGDSGRSVANLLIELLDLPVYFPTQLSSAFRSGSGT